MARSGSESGTLTREFYETDAATLARALLGHLLVRTGPGGERRSGVIVETEAYVGPEDLAAHSKGWRRTARNEALYGPPGMVYVFLVYGMHRCVNLVCGDEGFPTAVLIRAVEPVEGLEAMRSDRPAARRYTDLCSGPGKLCAAFGIDTADNETSALRGTHGPLTVERGMPLDDDAVEVTARIGVDYAGPEWGPKPLRWCVRGNPHVSIGKPSTGIVRGVETPSGDG
ncbi:MAG: DNA-3-methyladenine glycosylase [Planctomycetota bacterium]